MHDGGGKVAQNVVRQRRALLAAGAVQRIVPRGDDPLQVGDDAGIDLIGAGAREIGGHFAVLGCKGGDFPGRQRPHAGPLHPERRRPKSFPSFPLLLHEPLGRAGFGARGKPATPLALLVGEDGHEIALQVRVAPRDAWLEPSHQVRRDPHLHLRCQIVDPAQESIQQAELFLRQLRRAGLEGLGDRFLGR